MLRRRRWLLQKGVDYAKERVVFDRPIGQNQGVQFPLAHAYAELEADKPLTDPCLRQPRPAPGHTPVRTRVKLRGQELDKPARGQKSVEIDADRAPGTHQRRKIRRKEMTFQ